MALTATIDFDDEPAQQYLVECRENTATIKAALIAIKEGGLQPDEQRSESALQAVRSITAGAFPGLAAIRDLAQQMEEVLRLLHSQAMPPSAHRNLVLLHATDVLNQLVLNPRESNQANTAKIMAGLARLCAEHQSFAGLSRPSAGDPVKPGGRRLRFLLVEDDAASLLLLRDILSRYGECQAAGDGSAAVEEFRAALQRGQSYELVCLDIMMPEMDGCEALRQIRALESASAIPSESAAKIIMTSSVNDAKEVFRCFREHCDAYLIKPIELPKLLDQMKAFRMIQ